MFQSSSHQFATFFILIFLINLASSCGPNFLSYQAARLESKQHFDHVRLKQFIQPNLQFQPTSDPIFDDDDIFNPSFVEVEQDRPLCQQCEILDPDNPSWKCPILIKELHCQVYTVKYRGAKCLMANVTCLEPYVPDDNSLTYLGVVAYDLNNNKHALHFLYNETTRGLNDTDNFDLESKYPGRGFQAELFCNDNRKWTTFANNRSYIIDFLFCVRFGPDQLDIVRDMFPN